MSDDLTYEQFKELLQKQIDQLMDSLALAATGSLDIKITLPEGIPAITDVAIGFTYLVEDMQELLLEQQAMNHILEERVAERTEELKKRTQELEEALGALQTTQRRYIEQEWTEYTSNWQIEEELDAQIWSEAIATAVEKQQIISKVQNGHEPTVAVPLSYGNQLIGVLGFQGDEQVEWEAEELAAVEAIAEQVGLALENQRLFEQTQQALATTEKQAQNLSLLNQMAAELNTAINLDEIYRIAISRTLPIVEACYTNLILLGHQTGIIDSYAISNKSAEVEYQTNVDISNTIFQHVLENNQTILVNDVRDNNWAFSSKDQEYAVTAGAQSLMLIPINVQARIWGLIAVASPISHAFTVNQQSIIRQIISLLESTLANQYLFDQTQMALSESEALYDFSARLNTAVSLPEIVSAVVDTTSAEAATLFLTENTSTLRKPAWVQMATHWNSNNRPYTIAANKRFSIDELPGSELWLSRPNEVTFVDDVFHDNRLTDKSRAKLEEENIQAAAWIPLVINRRWIGLIVLSWVNSHQFTTVERRLYKTINTQTSVAFNQHRLTQDIQERAGFLEKLADIETGLSQAISEENIVATIAEFLANNRNTVSLYHIETDRQNHPTTQRKVVSWSQGSFDYNDPQIGKFVNVDEQSIAQIWLDSPNNVVYIADTQTENRLDSSGKKYYENLGVGSLAIIPLRSGGIWQGLLTLSSPSANEFSEEQRFLLNRLVESTSAVVASRRALTAQRAALAETETLYNASVEFNRAETIDDILKVIETTLAETGASSTALSEFQVDSNGRPIAQTFTAIRRNGKSITGALLNTTIMLADYPGVELWIDSPNEIQLISDITTDERTAEYAKLRNALQSLGVAAIAYLPLTLGRRWVGLVTIQWDTPYHFDEEDKRLYTTLAAQAATALDGLLLLKETQTRAAQLEILARAEGKLSTSILEKDILAAIADNLTDNPLVTLNYIDSDNDETPSYIYPVTTLQDGKPISVENADRQLVTDEPWAELWLDNPHQILVIANVLEDQRLNPELSQKLEEKQVLSLAYMPLQAVGRWQGSISITWPTPHVLTAIESYILQQLQEPVAAVVATRRSQIEQRRAEEALRITQRETEQLYQASRRINESGNNLSEIAAALGEVRPDSKVNRVVLLTYQYNNDQIVSAQVVGNWWGGQGVRPISIGTIYNRHDDMENIHLLFTRSPRFIDSANPQTDFQVKNIRKLFFDEKETASFALLPLIVSNKQMGVVILQGSQIYEFSEEDKRIYSSLLPQVAVAVENKLLLDDSQARARRERILREVTEKVRRSTDIDVIMKTAVQEVGRTLGRKTFIYLNQPDNANEEGQK